MDHRSKRKVDPHNTQFVKQAISMQLCRDHRFSWSIEHHVEYSILRYFYTERFEILVKEKINGVICKLEWDVDKNGWLFPIQKSDKIIDTVLANFPEWTFLYHTNF
jgi:hypothetical protein